MSRTEMRKKMDDPQVGKLNQQEEWSRRYKDNTVASPPSLALLLELLVSGTKDIVDAVKVGHKIGRHQVRKFLNPLRKVDITGTLINECLVEIKRLKDKHIIFDKTLDHMFNKIAKNTGMCLKIEDGIGDEQHIRKNQADAIERLKKAISEHFASIRGLQKDVESIGTEISDKDVVEKLSFRVGQLEKGKTEILDQINKVMKVVNDNSDNIKGLARSIETRSNSNNSKVANLKDRIFNLERDMKKILNKPTSEEDV